jgi:histidine triad (HIT) family protein
MSLHGPYDPDNIFAKILRGEAPAFRVYEDDAALAFMDIFPQIRGHTLVIPKLEARTLLTFPAERWGPFMAAVQKVSAAVERALQPEGIMLMQLNGAPAGQSVFHLHMHILPRWAGVKLRSHGELVMGDKGELETIAKQIAAAL